MASVTISVRFEYTFWWCPLCDDGAHFLVTLTAGKTCGEYWATPGNAHTSEECKEWCLANEPVDPPTAQQAGGAEPWESDDWRPTESDADVCGYVDEGNDGFWCVVDPECSICNRCDFHCEC